MGDPDPGGTGLATNFRSAALVIACACGGEPEEEPSRPGGCADHDDDGVCSPEDCDDEDASSHPGAAEVWYDGIDQACDGGNDYDADGDGHERGDEVLFYPPLYAPEMLEEPFFVIPDCDDDDPAVHPDALPVCGNGVDDDCDSRDDCSMQGAVTTPDLGIARLVAGSTVAAGDVDGDGLREWILNDSASFHAIVRPVAAGTASLEDQRVALVPYGVDLAFGDVGGLDGLDMVYNHPTYVIHVYRDPEVSQEIDAIIDTGPGGANAVTVGDLDGDGHGDVILGANHLREGAVFAGPIQGTLSDADASAVLLSSYQSSIDQPTRLGEKVDARGDLDADGLADVVASVDSPGFGEMVAVLPGPLAGTVYTEAGWMIGTVDDTFGVTGLLETSWDWNRDGYADVTTHMGETGYLYFGPFSADRSVASADAVVGGNWFPPEQHGVPEPCGDFNGDGFPDLAKLDDGVATILYGPFEGEYPHWLGGDLLVTSPDGEIVTLLPVGDVDGNGADDILTTVDRGDEPPWNELLGGTVLSGW